MPETRFAQSFQLTYRNAITRFDNWQFLTNAGLYFPGAFLTHNLVLQGAFQVRDTGVAFFSNNFPFSRGYTADNFSRMYKLGANYHFPLLYPDAGFADIVYFLRIRANVFYDYTKTFIEPSNQPGSIYRSFGTEIFFDTKWWNQQPVSFGFRYSRLIDPDNGGRSPNQWEFILPVNLIK